MSTDLLPENLPTSQLCAKARALVSQVERGLAARRNRDGVCAQVTDLWLCVQALALRAGSRDGYDSGPKARAWDDEAGGVSRGRERWDVGGGDPALLADEDGEDAADPDWDGIGWDADGDHRPIPMVELCEGDGSPDEAEAAMAAGAHDVEDWRMVHFGELLRYLVRGSREVDEISRRVLAICRRVMPEQLRAFAGTKPSQAAISRKARLGGERRATTCSREQEEVERVMREAGFSGWKGLGGTKSEGHRENCRRAQLASQGKNGSNRKRGHEARRRSAEEALGRDTLGDERGVEGRYLVRGGEMSERALSDALSD